MAWRDSGGVYATVRALLGQVIAGRYRLDSVLGIGGMGVVLRAHHVGLRRDVAIKMLRPELIENPEVTGRFEREALSLSRLEHPNCLQVTDFGQLDDGTLFMVMQLLEGWELTELLGQPLPVLQAVELGIQLLRGLEHAHRRKIIHRDLKPENLFLVRNEDESFTLKIIDFGIAKLDSLHPGDLKTAVGMIFGTPAYMSPEQALGAPVDHRADLYAVGCVLYEMLTGTPPFRDPDPMMVIHRRLIGPPPPLPDAISVQVREVVDTLVAREPQQRYQSATLALQALENAAVVLRRFARMQPEGEPAWVLPRSRASALLQETPERRDANQRRQTSGLGVTPMSEDDLASLRRRLDSVLLSPSPDARLSDAGDVLAPPSSQSTMVPVRPPRRLLPPPRDEED
ncbi:MAG: serine/threonine-protein kinase [Nannocystaceae bacterium]